MSVIHSIKSRKADLSHSNNVLCCVLFNSLLFNAITKDSDLLLLLMRSGHVRKQQKPERTLKIQHVCLAYGEKDIFYAEVV
jgi:hypothetical protein